MSLADLRDKIHCSDFDEKNLQVIDVKEDLKITTDQWKLIHIYKSRGKVYSTLTVENTLCKQEKYTLQ